MLLYYIYSFILKESYVEISIYQVNLCSVIHRVVVGTSIFLKIIGWCCVRVSRFMDTIPAIGSSLKLSFIAVIKNGVPIGGCGSGDMVNNGADDGLDRKSTRLNSSHVAISY